MITSAPTAAQIEEWKRLWRENREKLSPCLRSGIELIDYLNAFYSLEPADEPEILDTVSHMVLHNSFFAEKLPEGLQPSPVAFFVSRTGNGRLLYENREAVHAGVEKIIVSIDMVSGCYHVEGSVTLWDELCAYQGVDKADLDNFVRTGLYIQCTERRERFLGRTVTVTVDRPLGSSHPKHPDMLYTVNYGYVKGISAADGDWQDAYVLGVEHPLDSFTGVIAAVIHRLDDCEDKWVVVPDGMIFTAEEIAVATEFQERYFNSEIII